MWNELIKPELLVLMPFLYGVGKLIKNTPNINDWLIPYILLLVSIAITVVYMAFVIGDGFNGKTLVMAIIQGTFLALTTVGGNELYKQAATERKKDCAKKEEPSETDIEFLDEGEYHDNSSEEYYDYPQDQYPNDGNGGDGNA